MLSSRPSEARAGIHNHRRIDFGQAWSNIPCNREYRWLWVPAFAETTMSRKLLRRLQRRLRLFLRDPERSGALEQEICTERECHPPDGKRAGDADQRDNQRNR